MTPHSKRPVVAALLCALTLGSTAPAFAQRQDDPLADLLKALIESRLRKDQRGQRRRAELIPGDTANAADFQQRLNRLRPLAGSYVNSSARLVQTLNDDARRNAALRPLIGRALQLNAIASALTRRLEETVSEEEISRNLQQIDSQHRELAFLVDQLQPVPAATKRRMAELDRIREQVARVFDVAPQFDHAAVSELAAALVVSVDALVEDAAVELRATNAWRDVIQEGRRVQGLARAFRFSTAQRQSLDQLRADFTEFSSAWQPFATRLESFNNPYLARQVRRTHEVSRALAQHLMVPVGIDRTRLRYLAQAISEDTKSLFGFINLNVLSDLPDPARIPVTGVALRREVSGFVEAVASDQPDDVLRQKWQSLNAAWAEFSFALDAVRNKRIRAIAEGIDGSILAVRDELQIAPSRHTGQIARLAGSVDSLSEQLLVQARRWSRRDASGRAAEKAATAFHDRAHHLEDTVLDRATPDHVLADLQQAVAAWRELHPLLARCDTPEAPALDHLSSQITQNLIQLQTLLTE